MASAPPCRVPRPNRAPMANRGRAPDRYTPFRRLLLARRERVAAEETEQALRRPPPDISRSVRGARPRSANRSSCSQVRDFKAESKRSPPQPRWRPLPGFLIRTHRSANKRCPPHRDTAAIPSAQMRASLRLPAPLCAGRFLALAAWEWLGYPGGAARIAQRRGVAPPHRHAADLPPDEPRAHLPVA